MTPPNIKVSLLMENHMVVENLPMIYCVTKGYFIKVCFKDKEWFSISQDKLLKEFSNKIVFTSVHTNMQTEIFMKANSKITKNQEKVNTDLLMETITKVLSKKEKEVVMD